MTHVRQQIRERIASNVTGLTTTASRVYQSRVYNLEAANLPGLLVYSNNETSERDTIGVLANQDLDRTLELVIEGYASTASNLDDVLDLIAEEVETAVAADPTCNGLSKDLFLSETTISLTGEGDSPAGVLSLTFQVSYRTTTTAPGTAL